MSVRVVLFHLSLLLFLRGRRLFTLHLYLIHQLKYIQWLVLKIRKDEFIAVSPSLCLIPMKIDDSDYLESMQT